MAKLEFGKTWWGGEWINALNRIDYNENRLPRGKSYARNGKVVEIKIKNNVIQAKVKGSRPSPYKITIRLKPFDREDYNTVKGIVQSNISLAEEINMGKLPQSFHQLLMEEEVFIFPQSWKQIDAQCSCPDWANPCKHLAAVYYTIANEIDKNPFLLFHLRGITTEEMLSFAGLNNSTDSIENFPVIPFIPFSEINYIAGEAACKNHDIPVLDFDKTDLENVLSFLSPQPMFYHEGDFRNEIRKIYSHAVKNADLIQIKEESLHLKDTHFYIDYSFGVPFAYIQNKGKISITGSSEIISLPFGNSQTHKVTLKKTEAVHSSLEALFDFFLGTPLNLNTEEMSSSAVFFSYLASFSQALIMSGNFVPEVRHVSDTEFKIIYSPIISEEKTIKALDYLKSLLPCTMVFKERSVMDVEGVHEFLTLNITFIIKKMLFSIYKPCEARAETLPKTVLTSKKVLAAFFLDEIFRVQSFEETNIAKNISNWLQKLYIRNSEISPIIRIDTNDMDSYFVQIELYNRKDYLSPIIPLSQIFTQDTIFNKPSAVVKKHVVRQLTIAGEYFPELKQVLDKKGEMVSISGEEMIHILVYTKDLLTILGIQFSISKELRKIARPQLTVNAQLKDKNAVVSYLSLFEMLDFSYGISVGNHKMTVEEFKKLVKSSKGIVKYKDQYILLKPDEIEGIISRLNNPITDLNSHQMMQALLAETLDDLPFEPEEALRMAFENTIKPEDIEIPDSLNAKLRDYQIRGFRWLYSNAVKGFGSCLADDMGLGKTIQTITLILALKQYNQLQGKILIVCPMSLLANWDKELSRFAPSLSVSIYHGTERNIDDQEFDILITSYGTLRRDNGKLNTLEWGLLIADEAQNIKNHTSSQAMSLFSIQAKSIIALTGTPVENRLTELWSIFHLINKGYLGNVENFKRNFATPIEKYRNIERAEQLRKITSPFILRRLKKDKNIINDLPDKIINDEYCSLTKVQAALYQKVVDNTLKKIENSEGIERRGLIFSLITGLKQICNHPHHFSKTGETTSVQSGKADLLIQILYKILANNEKTLIFTQYKEMGEILEKIIRSEVQEETLFFHGGLTKTKRDKMVSDFQNNDNCKILVVSLKAGGTGLNLTKANNVIHYDLWWNPAVEDQATDRTFRIGQTKDVFVYRFITRGTFEEKINNMLEAKKELANMVVSSEEKWITEMSNSELKDLFALSNTF